MKKHTHLKCISNGRVFLRSDALASRDDMVPCDANGEIASGHISDAGDMGGPERRKTPYLGNTVNGVLYRYTDILAERDDMISIDSVEQWEQMQADGDAPLKAPEAIAPVLNRSTGNVQPTNQVDVPHETVVSPGIPLPDIADMNARNAKTALSEWAEKNFGQKIDRRPALPVVIDTCKALTAAAVKKAS